MPYQSVNSPRFYINEPLWLLNNGYDVNTNSTSFPSREIFNLSPSTQYEHQGEYNVEDNIHINLTNGYNYIAWLGHNFSDAQYRCHPKDENGQTIAADSGINYNENAVPTNNGFTFQFFDQVTNAVNLNFMNVGQTGVMAKCCSISVGRYYELPHSPDLNLTMTRDYSNIRTIETKGGASLSNDFGSKPPMWGDAAPWELWQLNTDIGDRQLLSRSGRRIWDLSWSYIEGSDAFGANQSLSSFATPTDPEGYDSNDLKTDGHFNTDILLDSNFYSQVIHKLNGTQFPFIFQADSNDTTAQSWAICKFDMNSFKFEQVANGVYNVKLKIREVW